jgi:hypothetical protein
MRHRRIAPQVQAETEAACYEATGTEEAKLDEDSDDENMGYALFDGPSYSPATRGKSRRDRQ